MWSKPSANAPASSSVPPKRTPPYSAKRSRRSSSSRIIFRKFLSQRTVMPYSATPPKPAITRSSSGSISASTSRTGSNGTRSPAIVMPRKRRVERLDLEPVDADHGVAVVDEVVRERESGRAHARRSARACRSRGCGTRPAQVERIPAREQRIDLEAPRQRQHVLQQRASPTAGCRPDPASGRCTTSCSRCRCGGRSPATIGLSMQIIASAPSGQPSARSLWNSEMRSSSGQPASVTLNGDLLERRRRPAVRLLLGQARARTSPCPARGTRCSSAPGRAPPTRSVPGSVSAKPSRWRNAWSRASFHADTPCRVSASTGTSCM